MTAKIAKSIVKTVAANYTTKLLTDGSGLSVVVCRMCAREADLNTPVKHADWCGLKSFTDAELEAEHSAYWDAQEPARNKGEDFTSSEATWKAARRYAHAEAKQ